MLAYVIFFLYRRHAPSLRFLRKLRVGSLRRYSRIVQNICKSSGLFLLPASLRSAHDCRKPTRQRISVCPLLGGVFWRRGTPKLVEQGASYSEGYKRYPNGGR